MKGFQESPTTESEKAPKGPHSPEEPKISEKFAKFVEGLNLPEGKRQEAAALLKEIESLETRALTDELTGLPNRTAFLGELARWQSLSERKGQDFCLVAFDLDGFKFVNDSFGHEMGNECLRLIAERVGGKLRPSDFFARIGGDEFIVLLPETDEREGMLAAEKIREVIQNEVTGALQELAAKKDPEKASDIQISASIGVDSKKRDESRDASALLRHVDYASYVVKAAGKKGSLTYEQAHQLDVESGGAYEKAFLEEK